MAVLVASIGVQPAFQPSFASAIALQVLEHSVLSRVFAPYQREVAFWAAEALSLEVADYSETMKAYFDMLRISVLRNELSKASKCLATLLVLMLKAKGYTEDDGAKLLPIFETLDWGSVKIIDASPDELIQLWLSYEPQGLEDFAYRYASITLSLLEHVPSSAFIRVLYTPLVREAYIAGFALLVITSTYFVYLRTKTAEEVPEVEAPP